MSLTPAAISKLKVAELKEQLEARGLDQTGKKEELVQRLTQAVEAEEDGGKGEQEHEAQETEEAPASATEHKHAWVPGRDVWFRRTESNLKRCQKTFFAGKARDSRG